MNTELLERLSKAAPDWISKRVEGTALHWEAIYWNAGDMEISNYPLINGDNEQSWLFFGAICGKIKAEDWAWYATTESCDGHRFGVVTETWIDRKTNEPKKRVFESFVDFDDGHLWQAAAIALCEALESRRCHVCKASPGEMHEDYCSVSQGIHFTGEQQEVAE